VWNYTSTPPYVYMAWCLVQHRYNCTFTYTGCTKTKTSIVLCRCETLSLTMSEGKFHVFENKVLREITSGFKMAEVGGQFGCYIAGNLVMRSITWEVKMGRASS